MKKKKVLMEYSVVVYNDGTIDFDGLDKYLDRQKSDKSDKNQTKKRLNEERDKR